VKKKIECLPRSIPTTLGAGGGKERCAKYPAKRRAINPDPKISGAK